ncbi:MAG: hypothetical protein AAF458_10020 [Pseudomonadota bacterium]
MTRQPKVQIAPRTLALVLFALLLSGCGEDPRLATQTTRITDLMNEVEAARNQLTDATAQLELARQQLELVTLERNELADAAAAQTNASSTAALQGDALRADLSAARDGLLLHAAALNIADADNLALAALIDALGDAARQAAAALPVAEEEVAVLSERVRTLGEERQALKDGWDTYRRRAMSLQQYVPQRSDPSAMPYKQALSSLSALQQSNRYLEQQVELFEAETLAMVDEINHLSEDLESANQAREALEIATRELNTRVNRAEVDARRATRAEKYVYELFEKRSVEATKLQADLKVAASQQADLAGQLADVMAERDGLVTELTAQREDAAALNTRLETAAAALAETRKRGEKAAAALTEKSATVESLEQETAQLKAETATRRSQIASLEQDLAEVTALSERLRSQVANTETAVTEAQAARKAAEAAHAQAAATVTALTAERDELKTLIESGKTAPETTTRE